MKHTPGPWEMDGSGAVFGPDGDPIMTCGLYAVCFGEGSEEGYANARLIAAAPDLLAACVEFVRKVECGEARSKRSYAQMKAAIKKAEEEDR